MDKFWAKLKSGTDIRGVAIGTENSPVTLTDGVIYAATAAFLYWLSKRIVVISSGAEKSLTIAVGHDSRLSSPRIKNAVICAARDVGCKVYDCGLCSTPSIFMMTQYTQTAADGAIMVTASHHSYDKNGLKFFTADGGVESEDLTEILELASSGKTLPKKVGCRVIEGDFLGLYCAHLVKIFRNSLNDDLPLLGLKIAVDAGNGAGGFFCNRVLEPLGADTSGSRFLEPDGSFPNHSPNPENPAAMLAAAEMVLDSGADFGIIFDTDVDRAGFVGAGGKEINRNRLIALISAIILLKEPNAAIVTDSVTSEGLTEFIVKHSGTHRRFKRGYRNVINEAVRLNAPLAIETSGHAAFRENYFLDDGAYLAVKILTEICRARREGRNILDEIASLREPSEEKEFRLKFKNGNLNCGAEVLESLVAACKNAGFDVDPDSCEGIRAFMHGGNFILRQSVHDPLLSLNIESYILGGVKKIARELLTLLTLYKELDLTPLTDYIKNGDN